MNLFDILKQVCTEINQAFPNQNIYINQVPQGFTRPSFYVSPIAFSDRDLVQDALIRNTAFQVVYFSPKDARGNTDVVSQYTAYVSLAGLFQHHGLQVLDRNIKITSVDGGPRDAEVYLTINFEYAFTPEDLPSPEELYETLQDLQMKYIFN